MVDIRSWIIIRSNGQVDEWLSPLGSVGFHLHTANIGYSMKHTWCCLGSLFNHSSHPNVTYTLDPAHECIRYTSARTINPDEELCIFYGHKLWFDPVDITETLEPQLPLDKHSQSDILAVDNKVGETRPLGPGDPNDVLQIDTLPFIWKKLQIDEEEENMEDIRTSKLDSALRKLIVTRRLVQAWVVDIPDSKHIATMLK